MKITRQRFQLGTIRKVERKASFVWEYRYRDHSQPGSPIRQRTLSGELYPTESKALAAVQAITLEINGTDSYTRKQYPTMGVLIDRFIESERILEVKAIRPGEPMIEGAVQYSTACSYLTILNRYIKPRWAETRIKDVTAYDVDEWLRSLRKIPKSGADKAENMPLLSAKYKGNIKSKMHRLFEKAMFWQLIPLARNPIGLIEIKGVSRRRKKPFCLTAELFIIVLSFIPEPYKQMALVAMCLGLRVSEILALRWPDFDFDNLSLHVVRAVVHGRVADVKTEYSEDELPLDADFAAVMSDWKSRCPASAGDWVFPNPETGEVYHASPIQQDYIRAAGRMAGLAKDIGWHTFRHTYRSLLDDTGAPVGVQQKLMRHAQVATTMNTYGNAQMQTKRTINSKVVQMVLPKAELTQVAV